MEKTREPLREAIPDHMHLDDFLNTLEAAGKVELAAAFALWAKAKGFVKRTFDEWRKDFEAFMHDTPK